VIRDPNRRGGSIGSPTGGGESIEKGGKESEKGMVLKKKKIKRLNPFLNIATRRKRSELDKEFF